MGIKPEGTNPVVVPPDNVQSRWGAWEASIDVAGQQAGEVFAETHAIATSANSVAATALSEARTYQSEAVAATEALEQAIDPEHPDSHIFRLIQSIDEAQNQALELHADAIAANEAAVQELTKAVQKYLYVPDSGTPEPNDEWMVSRSGSSVSLTAKGSWTGSAIVIKSDFEAKNYGAGTVLHRNTSSEFYPVPGQGNSRGISVSSTKPPSTGLNAAPAEVVVIYTVNPGAAVPVTVSNSDLQTLAPSTWVTVAEWTVPKNTNIVANAEMEWANKTWAATYGMRLTLDGANITTSESSSTAPIIGHRPRRHNVSTSRRKANAGQVLRVQAFADHSNSLNRQVRDVKLNITWIDGAV